MRRPNFFSWYFNQALHKLLEIWKNYLLFTIRYFSLGEMIATLFSPWRRDVRAQDWRGFHPGKMLELLVENLMSRLIGAIVRFFVLVFGLAVLLFVFAFGLLVSFLWVCFPLVIVLAFWEVFAGVVGILFAGEFLLFWIVLSLILFWEDSKKDVLHLEFEELKKHPVFERICARLGTSKEEMMQGALENEQLLQAFLKSKGLTLDDYRKILQWEMVRWQKNIDRHKFWRADNLMKTKPIGLQWRYAYTVNLDRYCQDLSQGDYSEYSSAELVGRQEEYQVLKLLLERPDQNCALIVGPSGIGKKTLFHELARNARHGKEPNLFTTRFLLMDLGRIISDAINRGEDVENFLRLLFFEASYAGNIILIIEHLEHFMGKNSSAFHPDISAVLGEFLSVPTFRIIALSSTQEYHNLIEREQEIVKYFEVMEMREPSETQTQDILLRQLEKYEQQRVLFTFASLKHIILQSSRHNWSFPLPERALDLAMDVLTYWEKNSAESLISEKTVNEYLSLKTGVKQGEIEGDEKKKLLDLENILHRQVIGQEEAVSEVCQALKRSRSGIANGQKPIGSFLFLGPTGVGKTETAKALAKAYFGSEDKMIRIDMSEFQSPSSLDRLIGSSQLNQQGRLITQIKDNPYSLLLLDEIEKAYPEILDIFLQILDEGFVTDAFGEKINFRNTIIIATSNAGAMLIKQMVENQEEAQNIKQAVIDYAIENNVFRTEFLNRFSDVIFFKPLNDNELVSVVKLQLRKIARRMNKEKNIEIMFDDKLVNQIIEKGYNPIFGARSINRYIENAVESLVAEKIIAGEVGSGQTIKISL